MAFNEIFALGNPFTIAGFVVFPVRNPSNHIVKSRFRTHVSEKVFKCFPSAADFDSFVTSIAPDGSFAAHEHITPRDIGRSPTESMRFRTIMSYTASATSGEASLKILGKYDRHFSAGTFTLPSRLFRWPCRSLRKHRKLAELMTFQIKKVRHL